MRKILLVLTAFVFTSTAFCQDTIRTIKSGLWSDSTTWSPSIVPGANAVVILDHDLTIDQAANFISIQTMNQQVTVLAGVKVKISGSELDNAISNTPHATPAFDQSSFGVYKAVLIRAPYAGNREIDSTANLEISIDAAGKALAYIHFGSLLDTLTSPNNLTPGVITAQPFASKHFKLSFSCNADGSMPFLSDIFFQDSISMKPLILKEYSNNLVSCLEGLLTQSLIIQGQDYGDYGPVVALLNSNKIIGIGESGKNMTDYSISGNVDSNNINADGSTSTGAIFTGKVNGIGSSGTWSNQQGNSFGHWSLKRTL